MPPTLLEWQRAFARQARADLDAEEVLRTHGAMPVCQHLHMLQMACEKLGKAFLCRGGTPPDRLQASHAYIRKVLPVMAMHYASRQPSPPLAGWSWEMASIRQLAGEIEVLAPAVTRSRARTDNCEYPWLDGSGAVRAPCDEVFGSIEGLLSSPRVGPLFHKILRGAAADLAC